MAGRPGHRRASLLFDLEPRAAPAGQPGPLESGQPEGIAPPVSGDGSGGGAVAGTGARSDDDAGL